MCGVFTGAAATRSRSGLGQGLSTLRSQRAWQNFLLPPNSRLFRQNCLYSTSAFLNKVRHCVWYPLACGWFFCDAFEGREKRMMIHRTRRASLSGTSPPTSAAVDYAFRGELLTFVPLAYRYGPKLQAPVYDILPSTTAVFSYATGSGKLSANEQFFCWCSNSSKFVTNNSDKTRRVVYNRQQSLHQHK